jgi:glycosyltransferase involved in cell wall biosynthesis
MENPNVSVVITSCGRQDLLDRTISSFLEFNTYPILEYIVIEDGNGELNAPLIEKFKNLPFTWLETGHRVGQIQAIDQVYARVRAPFVFHCEDDWEFYAPGFVEKSILILKGHPEVLQVYLRAHDDTNRHPIMQEVMDANKVPFRFLAWNFQSAHWGIWHGFSFNPGLRRMTDYRSLGSFAAFDPDHYKKAWQIEQDVSAFFKERGFRAVILADNAGKGYVRHIGVGRQISMPRSEKDFMFPLPPEQNEKFFQIEIADKLQRIVTAGVNFDLEVRIQNNTELTISSEGPNPVHFSYHWLDSDGSIAWFDGERTKFVPPLQARATRHYLAKIEAPPIAGNFQLQPALVQEGSRWYDQYDAIPFEVRHDNAVEPNPRDLALWLAEKAFKEKNRDTLRQELSKLDGYAIDEGLIRFIDRYLGFIHAGKKKIATADPRRMPGPNELIVVFGSYPYAFSSLAVNNPIKRNLLEFWSFTFDKIEFEECWNRVDQIFVVNRDDRPDRWYSSLRELTRMGAPLDRITRFSASVDRPSNNPDLTGQLGCLRSHLRVMQTALAQKLKNIMVLEDDFGFTDELELNRRCLQAFFSREYEFDVCLLATSRYGIIIPKDDLVAVTRQPCTTTGGYIASQSGIPKLIDCFSASLDQMIKTGDHVTYSVDRCWSSLQQDERFLVFKRRLGFQLPSFSDIQERMSAAFD